MNVKFANACVRVREKKLYCGKNQNQPTLAKQLVLSKIYNTQSYLMHVFRKNAIHNCVCMWVHFAFDLNALCHTQKTAGLLKLK